MSTTSQKLERLLDAIADDIFDDVECAKAVINEAGYDSILSSTKGAINIAQLKEDIFRASNTLIVYDLVNYSLLPIQQPSIEYTIFNLDGHYVEEGLNITLKLVNFKSRLVKQNVPSIRKKLDEEKLLLN